MFNTYFVIGNFNFKETNNQNQSNLIELLVELIHFDFVESAFILDMLQNLKYGIFCSASKSVYTYPIELLNSLETNKDVAADIAVNSIRYRYDVCASKYPIQYDLCTVYSTHPLS